MKYHIVAFRKPMKKKSVYFCFGFCNCLNISFKSKYTRPMTKQTIYPNICFDTKQKNIRSKLHTNTIGLELNIFFSLFRYRFAATYNSVHKKINTMLISYSFSFGWITFESVLHRKAAFLF